MSRSLSRPCRLFSAALGLALLAGCGAAPSSPPESDLAQPGATQTVPEAAVEVPADKGRNRARIEVDGVVHEFSSDSGGVSRNSVPDAPEIELITLETYNQDNTLYAKVDFNVPTGGDPVGEYLAGMLSQPEHRTAVGHGQVILAVETDPAVGRNMYPSGSGRFMVTRVGEQYRVDFETQGDGQFRSKDAAPITGYLLVGDPPK